MCVSSLDADSFTECQMTGGKTAWSTYRAWKPAINISFVKFRGVCGPTSTAQIPSLTWGQGSVDSRCQNPQKVKELTVLLKFSTETAFMNTCCIQLGYSGSQTLVFLLWNTFYWDF